MRNIVVFCRVCLTLTLPLSCASTQQTVAPRGAPAVYDFTTEGRIPPPPEVLSTPTSAGASRIGLPSSSAAAETDPGHTQGWRVQVFAGLSLETAETIRQEIQKQGYELVYIDHVAPYYKVRVGDCATRHACEELQRQLHSAGRQSAWVVPSLIHR